MRKQKDIDNLLHTLPENIKPICENFSLFLSRKTTKRGTMSTNRIYNHLVYIRLFLRDYCDYNIAMLDFAHFRKVILEHSVFKISFVYFATFLNVQNMLPKKIVKKIIKLEIPTKEAVTKHKKDYKFIIPHERWNELLQHPEVKKYHSRHFTMYFDLYTALRRIELINLKRKEDFFLQAERPFVQIQAHPEDEYYPKTIESERKIFLFPEQIRMVEYYFSYLDTLELDHDFVLINNRKQPYSYPDALNKWMAKMQINFTEYGKKVVKTIRPHALRYTACWFFYNKTKNLYAVSNFMGHKSIEQTISYMGLTKAQKEEEIFFMMQQALT